MGMSSRAASRTDHRLGCAGGAFMLFGVLSFVFPVNALGQSPAPSSGYDNTWYISEFWSGEYPSGFSVTRPGTSVLARAKMDKAAARDVTCKLPYLAVIHPWNKRRIAKSKIKFVSATRIVHLVVKEPFVFDGLGGDKRIKVQLKKGDAIDYIRNDAEGAFEVRIFGKQYTAGQNLFDHVQDVAQDQFVEEDWVALTCEDGNRAYVFLSDLMPGSGDAKNRMAGISGVGPGQTGYGQARDLTAGEAKDLESAGEK
jgi:hypothetical protein